jgi:hypothetical protein
MTEELKNILSKIDELERIKYDSQKAIRNYCIDKSNPLDQRWDVWVQYTLKEEEDYALNPEDFENPLLKYLCEKINDHTSKGHEVDYSRFIDNVTWFDEDDYEQIPIIMRDVKLNFLLNNRESDIYNKSIVNEELDIILREAIMDENFGAYRFDW